jgi:Helix-turn-helix domain
MPAMNMGWSGSVCALHCVPAPSPEGKRMIDRSAGDTAPVLSADFWGQPEIRFALLSRHFGRFLRVYRMIQSPPLKQADVARWLGITQGQLSKIERSSTPVQDLAKLDRWARALHVPADLLWFSQSPDSSAAHDAPLTH